MKYKIGTIVAFGAEPQNKFEIIGDKETPYIMKFDQPAPVRTVTCPSGMDYILRPLELKKEFEPFRFAPEWDLNPLE